jgi:hypothetical protein|nr:MAG TPA: hypothetical protein [Caudoviricetes sp.]
MPFELSKIISSIKPTVKAIDVPLNTEDAERFLQLTEAAKAALVAQNTAPRSITDVGPGVAFQEELDELRKQTITLRLRALSNKELQVLKRRVWTDPVFSTKNKSADEKAVIDVEREDRLMEYIVATACVEVIDNSTGESQMGLTDADAAELRGYLPEFLWQQICTTWNDAQTLGVVVSEAISDPTFRGDGAVEAGESVDAALVEDSEG